MGGDGGRRDDRLGKASQPFLRMQRAAGPAATDVLEVISAAVALGAGACAPVDHGPLPMQCGKGFLPLIQPYLYPVARLMREPEHVSRSLTAF